jgi:hypothetical protein
MRIPPPPERIKEAPAHALRAVFAGVGQVLLITERVRQRAIEQVHPQMTSAPAHAPAPDVPPPPPPPRSAAAAATQAAASRVAAPAAAAPAAAAPAAAAPAAAAPAVARAEAPAPEAAAPQGGAAVLPVPSYDELSIASLRARLRALDAAQVRDLLDYERAHASRANVITMFERRIAKLEGTENADTTAG